MCTTYSWLNDAVAIGTCTPSLLANKGSQTCCSFELEEQKTFRNVQLFAHGDRRLAISLLPTRNLRQKNDPLTCIWSMVERPCPTQCIPWSMPLGYEAPPPDQSGKSPATWPACPQSTSNATNRIQTPRCKKPFRQNAARAQRTPRPLGERSPCTRISGTFGSIVPCHSSCV